TAAEAGLLAHKPQKLADRVYGIGNPKKAREFGHTKPGDGWRYRGGGDLQLTGANNYKRAGEWAGVDLYADPDKIEDYRISFRVAVAEFKALGCIAAAKKDNVGLVTRRVNGGRNGLAERAVWLKKWKQALPDLPDALPKPKEADQLPRGA